MEIIIEEKTLHNEVFVFKNRHDAGKRLAEKLVQYKDTNSIILPIPSGGIPVGKELAKSLNLPFDLIIVRKLQIPWNPEAGFGAINLDGDMILNEQILDSLSLSQKDIEHIEEKTKETLEKREELFRKGREFPIVKGQCCILVDDGLASGYTMLAAVRFIKRRNPVELVVATPTGSYNTVNRIASEVDRIACLNIREGIPFAVADAYKQWHDLSDKEVLELLEGVK